MKVVQRKSGGVAISVSVLVLMILIGCTAYTLKEPKSGLTRTFQSASTTSSKYFDGFDSTKGLFVFTYRIEGKSGMGGADNYDIKEGIRIWEHKFKPNEAEFVTKNEVLNLYVKETPMLTVSQVTRTYQTLPVTYRRGRIVYGGHLHFLARDKNSGSRISLIPSDQEFQKFLNAHSERIKSIPVDTAVPKYGYVPGDDF